MWFRKMHPLDMLDTELGYELLSQADSQKQVFQKQGS